MKKTMRAVTSREAKSQLSKLVDQAAKGEPFIITKGGKPLVKVTAIAEAAPTQVRRLGFMAGKRAVPDDFDEMGRSEIERAFEKV